MAIDTNIIYDNWHNNSHLEKWLEDNLNYYNTVCVRNACRNGKGLLQKEISNTLKAKDLIVEVKFVIKKVIFSDPATIVLWSDGTKTVVKTQNGDPYDPEKGLAMACMRKMLSKKDYHKHLEKAQRVKNIPINEEERSNGV
jgi:hypothetical protein